jgi:hypothetical protein
LPRVDKGFRSAHAFPDHSFFFDGELTEKRPDGNTVSIPVLLEREIIQSQNKTTYTREIASTISTWTAACPSRRTPSAEP